MIQSFADKESELVWQRSHVRKFGSDLQRTANRKLLILDAAETLNDLRIPPGNRLEPVRQTGSWVNFGQNATHARSGITSGIACWRQRR